ncbi:MAG: hypothetical protein DUW69_001610 [Verrucomicrobia bacterium]|nr:MAG: hypothetical protein DUW69_001610 [Verrucomicrobiota bacterium]
MNLIRLLPPAVALVLVGTWLGILHLSIAAMDSENRLLRQHIAAARRGGPADTHSHAKTDKPVKDNAPLDWSKLAGGVAWMQKSGGLGDLRTMVHLQQRLQSMTREELVAALDKIATLGLPNTSRAILEPWILAPLIDQDPALVLTRFTTRLGDPDEAMHQQLAAALKAYAKSDPRKAVAWFDQQVAAGGFESSALNGRSQTRLQFEGALLGVLLSADPSAAAGRLAALPEDQRAEAIGNAALDPGAAADLILFAKLVRSQVPAAEQSAAFARQAGQWAVQGDYASVTAYLNALTLTPEERLACIEQAVTTQVFSTHKKLAAADLDNLRKWVASQAPQVTNSLTANILCSAALANRKLDFAQAAALAIHCSQADGNDDVLVHFVEIWAARADQQQARELAGKIPDAKRRTETIKHLESPVP